LHTLGADLRATVLDVRRLVEGLRPPALDELGLGPAVHQAVARLASGAAPTIDVDVPADLPPIPAAVEVAVYRIICEAVTNAIRHAAATRCAVTVRAEGGALVASIVDDGRGVPAPAATSGGHGLDTMRERAEELGGNVRLGHDGGTSVLAWIPLHARPAVAP
ncbi:MAG TPA: ATP-binding protein, partial [Micromonosporaceae bacterium]|nr:ATP-binding protein [Micromonosporaceae bacterium]